MNDRNLDKNGNPAHFNRRDGMKVMAASVIGATGLVVGSAAAAQENPGVGRTYVLVPGAWHGGWVWRDTAPALRELGHIATTPTLSGLGERKHLLQDTADLSTHIEDVVSHIEMEGLTDVDLVGWSYAGMVITGVQQRIPDKIRSLIFLDAFVPEDGKRMFDYVGGPSITAYNAAKTEDRAINPIPLNIFGVNDPEVEAFVNPRLTLQPWRTFFEPVKASPDVASLPTTYILCTGWEARSPMPQFIPVVEARGAKIVRIPSDHFCMLTAPKETVAALVSAI